VTKNAAKLTEVLRANVAQKEKPLGFNRPGPLNSESLTEALERERKIPAIVHTEYLERLGQSRYDQSITIALGKWAGH
jgi:hypothetical protein